MYNTTQLAPGSLGGLVQGNFGQYQAGSDGTYTVDSRDVPALLVQGMAYVSRQNQVATVTAPLIATVGRIVASATLSNGSLSIANQPDVMRQINVRVDPGTLAVTAGSLSVTYVGNDGVTTTDVISLATPASTVRTVALSKGVARINTPVVSLVAGGATPHIQLDTTTGVSVPVNPGTVDFVVALETVDGANEAVGTVSTTTLGTIAPTTAPNNTHTYTFTCNSVAGTI